MFCLFCCCFTCTWAQDASLQTGHKLKRCFLLFYCVSFLYVFLTVSVLDNAQLVVHGVNNFWQPPTVLIYFQFNYRFSQLDHQVMAVKKRNRALITNKTVGQITTNTLFGEERKSAALKIDYPVRLSWQVTSISKYKLIFNQQELACVNVWRTTTKASETSHGCLTIAKI